MFTVVRSSIQSADGQARTGAGWCANRLTRGRCASKISIRLTFRGRSTWPTRSGSRTIRIIILRTSRERREKVRPSYRGLFSAVLWSVRLEYLQEHAAGGIPSTRVVPRVAATYDIEARPVRLTQGAQRHRAHPPPRSKRPAARGTNAFVYPYGRASTAPGGQ